METVPRNCRFLSLVVVERVLTNRKQKKTYPYYLVRKEKDEDPWLPSAVTPGEVGGGVE